MLKTTHLIAGEWIGGEALFTNEPVNGKADSFAVGTPDLVDRACQAAEDAFWSYGYSDRDTRLVSCAGLPTRSMRGVMTSPIWGSRKRVFQRPVLLVNVRAPRGNS